MKRSRKPTDQIIIKANIRSKIYTVEFAILRISPEWVGLTNQRLAAIKNFEAGFCVYNYSFWHSPLRFYKSPIGQNFPVKILPKYEDWAFITLGLEEENTLSVIETCPGAHQLIITKDGIAHFRAHGRHSGEEFWTEEFNLYKLIAKL
nr:hypothetical protein [Pedobacter panaciterrae]